MTTYRERLLAGDFATEEEEPRPDDDDDDENGGDELEQLTNAELQDRLAAVGLPTSGNKAELVARLRGAST